MTNWASRHQFTPLPPGVEPLTRLAGSQAEHFGVEIVPLDPNAAKHGTLPSFAFQVQESIRRMKLVTRFGGRLSVLAHDKKDDGYALARRAGVEVPLVHAEAARADQLDWAALPARVVVKPLRGAASRGVFLLERHGDGQCLDHLTGERISEQEVVRQLLELADDRRVSAAVIAEEFLQPHPSLANLITVPDDLKVFTFYDHPAVIMQRRCFGTHDMSQYRFRFWDAEWNDLGGVKYADRLDPTMPPPELRDEVVDAVTRLGRELAVPFARIDVYETARGVVFGEITPHPGPPAGWRADLDRLLGYEWEIAEARLAAEGRTIVDPAAGR